VRLRSLPGWVRDTVLRMFPHAVPPGLRPIGQPGPDAPVLVTGNFALTVRRVADALAGRDAWLLVANSRGINVWCAAGGGHLTHHDVIAAVRASGLAERVTNRTLVLPQLAATGVERSKVTEATGFSAKWGPARLEDIGAFLDRGAAVTKTQRFMRFPLWERLEMALMWALPIGAVATLVIGLCTRWRVGLVSGAVLFAAILGVFAAIPRVRVTGAWRWPTFAAFAALSFGAIAGILPAIGSMSIGTLVATGIGSLVSMLALCVDIAGTTPFYPGNLNMLGNQFQIELVEAECTGAAQCVQVCPRDVLAMDGHRRKVAIARPDDCVRCGACIVQCPDDALRFRFDDGRIVEPQTVRSTRMNMVGRRTVRI